MAQLTSTLDTGGAHITANNGDALAHPGLGASVGVPKWLVPDSQPAVWQRRCFNRPGLSPAECPHQLIRTLIKCSYSYINENRSFRFNYAIARASVAVDIGRAKSRFQRMRARRPEAID